MLSLVIVQVTRDLKMKLTGLQGGNQSPGIRDSQVSWDEASRDLCAWTSELGQGGMNKPGPKLGCHPVLSPAPPTAPPLS